MRPEPGKQGRECRARIPHGQAGSEASSRVLCQIKATSAREAGDDPSSNVPRHGTLTSY